MREEILKLYQIENPLLDEKIVVFDPSTINSVLEELRKEKYRREKIKPKVEVYFFEEDGLTDQIERGKEKLSEIYLKKSSKSLGLSIFRPALIVVSGYLAFPVLFSLSTFPLKNFLSGLLEYYRERSFQPARSIISNAIDKSQSSFIAALGLLGTTLPFLGLATYYGFKHLREYKNEKSSYKLFRDLPNNFLEKKKSKNLKEFSKDTHNNVKTVRENIRNLLECESEQRKKFMERIISNMQEIWVKSKKYELYGLDNYYINLLYNFCELDDKINRMPKEKLKEGINEIESNSYLFEVFK